MRRRIVLFAGTFLVRLRIIHPIVAVGVTGYLLWWVQRVRVADPLATRLGTALTGLLVLQLFGGVLNVLLLAPVWMQVIHLLLADAVWIVFVLFAAEAVAAEQRESQPVAA